MIVYDRYRLLVVFLGFKGFLDGFDVVEEGSPSKDIVEHEDSVAEAEIHSKTNISETLEFPICQWPKIAHNSYCTPIASPAEVYRLVREYALDDCVVTSERAVIPYVRIFDINEIKVCIALEHMTSVIMMTMIEFWCFVNTK